MESIYIVGSLRNPLVPIVGDALRKAGYEAFDDWYSAGPEADDCWQRYETERNRTYKEALNGYHANCVFNFDKFHLDRSHAGILVMPAGRSGHLEIGYLRGQGKPTYILFDSVPDRYDVMYRFQEQVFFSVDEVEQYFKSKPSLQGLRQDIRERDNEAFIRYSGRPNTNIPSFQQNSERPLGLYEAIARISNIT